MMDLVEIESDIEEWDNFVDSISTMDDKTLLKAARFILQMLDMEIE